MIAGTGRGGDERAVPLYALRKPTLDTRKNCVMVPCSLSQGLYITANSAHVLQELAL